MFVYIVLLSMFGKLQKVAVSFIMAGFLLVCMEQLGSDWMDFHESLYLSTFRICAAKIEVLLKSDKNSRYFMWRPIYIYDYV
jgi:hypothetical protein